MAKKPAGEVMFPPTVRKWQEARGSRQSYARMAAKGGLREKITPDLLAFLAERDSFYLATADASGQPYIQHRGGKKGFLKALDDTTLAFADFSGNKQYISAGNLEDNPKAFIFLMDYANRRRIKIWGEARTVEDDPALLEKVVDADYRANPERVIVFKVTAWDINCPQHIPVKFDLEEVEDILGPFRQRIAELETRLAKTGKSI